MSIRTPETKKAGGSDQAQVMSLSLFLLLLAFFIVLSTMIEYDQDKMDRLKIGLEEAFISSDVPGGAGELDQGTEVGEAIAETFGEIENLMRLNIGVSSLQKFEGGSIMVITVKADDLLSADSQSLDTLARLLSYSKSPDVHYEMEALYGIGDNPATVPLDIQVQAIKKMDKFARTMTQYALPTHAMAIGISKGKEGMVDLILYAQRKNKSLIKLNPTQIKRGFGGMTGGGA